MDKIQVEKPDFIVGIDDIKIPCFEKTFVSANELCVAVGTTGHKGGDSGHGGRTYFRLTNDCCTDMNVSVIDEHSYEHDFDSANGVTIMLGGDCELDTFYECLRYAVNILEKHTKGVEEYMPTRMEMRQQSFCMYINDLCNSYRKNHNKLVGMSEIREKHHITGITKDQFFACGLHQAKGYVSQDFTDRLYDYILDNTKNTPAPLFKD